MNILCVSQSKKTAVQEAQMGVNKEVLGPIRMLDAPLPIFQKPTIPIRSYILPPEFDDNDDLDMSRSTFNFK